jgi:serine/threonine-protein kinase
MSEEHKTITVGRYLLHRKIARGGMATIHIARLMGDVGFSRIVAAKRMHPELIEDSEFVAMFLDEARIASKVQHRNVVNVLDVVTLGDEVMLVQEYVHGAPLSLLVRKAHEAKAPIPVPVAAAIACQVLAGLHAAHETRDEMGQPLHIVHRDVSPQNVIVGADGTARLLDFGVAKAALGAHVSRKGTFKGKLGYSSPEQIRGQATRHSDIYAAGVVLWELLVGHRLHDRAQGEAELIAEIIAGRLPTITEALESERSFIGTYRWGQLEQIEPVVKKALDVQAKRRWETAADMEEAIAAVAPIASAADVAAWLRAVAHDFLDEREKLIAEEEASWRRTNGAFTTFTPRPRRIPTMPSALLRTEPGSTPLETAVGFWRRAPTAFIAALVVVFIGLVTFLVRDLDGTAVTPAPAATPPPTAEARIPRAVPVRNDPAVSIEHSPMALDTAGVATTVTGEALESEAQTSFAAEPAIPETTVQPSVAAPRPAPATAVKPLRTKPAPVRVVRTPVRPVVRPDPAPVAAPPPPPVAKPTAPALDCTTPFYFEGKKKIFKAACL